MIFFSRGPRKIYTSTIPFENLNGRGILNLDNKDRRKFQRISHYLPLKQQKNSDNNNDDFGQDIRNVNDVRVEKLSLVSCGNGFLSSKIDKLFLPTTILSLSLAIISLEQSKSKL
ncbi:hypothetical protein DERP_002506 [Dermatophagoides pteronyssinus]|uniref:Uncharacterized protein n=1 Tax=Dermatophagoides pteronyssinus TaxID=6956 RepID=A0ABQ8JHX5_DERPT|nr:hypothetical protein DERP_002506 [Dermatophagoides pteronyssinus]